MGNKVKRNRVLIAMVLAALATLAPLAAEAGNPHIGKKAVSRQLQVGRLKAEPWSIEGTERLLGSLVAKGDPEAQFLLAKTISSKGALEPERYEQARRLYEAAAEKGYAPAQLALGKYYSYLENNLGIANDPPQALKWYRKAAMQGYAPAQTALADLYGSGDTGVAKDTIKALHWYRKAAAKGNTDAMTALGDIYAEGEAVPKNLGRAAKWYRKAASRGAEHAQYKLGRLYYEGAGVKRNIAKSVYWLRKSLAQFNNEARDLLEEILEKNPAIWPRPLFPNALSELSYDGRPRNFRVAGRILDITPVRFHTGSGINSHMIVCGLIIRQAKHKPQGLATYGEWNEITEMDTCEKLIGIGIMPPLDGATRLGLIYYIGNGTDDDNIGRMVVIEDSKTRQWRIDKSSSETVSGLMWVGDEGKEIKTLTDMRKALRNPIAPVPASPAE